MKKNFVLFILLAISLNCCTKHEEIVYESLNLTDSFWMAYEVDNNKLNNDEQFMFNFSKSQLLNILFLNPNNNKYETRYSFYYSDFKDNSAIVDGYFLSSKEYKEAIIHYKKINSDINKLEFKLRLYPDSDYIIMKMNRLTKE